MKNIIRNADALIVPGTPVVLWEIAGKLSWLPDYLPPPSQIGEAFSEVALSGELLRQSAPSLLRAIVGLALGASAGVVLGLVAGRIRPVRDLVEPLIIVLNPIPKIAFLPLFVIAFGMGHGSKFAIIAIATFFPTFVATLDGVASVPTRLIWAARSMGASPLRLLFQVYLRAALPAVFAGLRIAVALSFIVLFAAELMGSKDGLGYVITTAEAGLRFDLVFVAIIVIGVFGFMADRILLFVRRIVLRGTFSDKELAR